MKLLDNTAVQTIIKHLSSERLDMEKMIENKKKLVEILDSITQVAIIASKQLKENDKLDKVIESKRKTLVEIEDGIEDRAKEEAGQIFAIDKEITAEKKRLTDARTDCDKTIKEVNKDCGRKTASARIEADKKLSKYEEDVKQALKRKQKAVSECDEMENKLKTMKEDLIAKL